MAIKLEKHSMARKMAAKTKLVMHLDKAIDKAGDFSWTYQYDPKGGDDAWHPSGDCTPSPRELFNKAVNPERDPIGANLRKTFQVGHFWHGYLQEVIVNHLGFADASAIERKGQKVWAEEDGKPKPYHWVRGAADVAPISIPGFGDYLLDIKTMGSHDFRKTELPDWSAGKYEAQMNIYMDFFDLEKALILGVNKDSPHEFKEFEFVRNQPLIDTIYRKWELVSHCIADGVVPPGDEVIELPFQGSV